MKHLKYTEQGFVEIQLCNSCDLEIKTKEEIEEELCEECDDLKLDHGECCICETNPVNPLYKGHRCDKCLEVKNYL